MGTSSPPTPACNPRRAPCHSESPSMSLFSASLIPGLLLIALGVPLLLNIAGVTSAIRAFPRSASAGYLVFGAAAAWFLYNILHLSNADFGEYRYYLFAGFAAVAVLSFKCVPDFLGVRGASALVLISATPFLDSAYICLLYTSD